MLIHAEACNDVHTHAGSIQAGSLHGRSALSAGNRACCKNSHARCANLLYMSVRCATAAQLLGQGSPTASTLNPQPPSQELSASL